MNPSLLLYFVSSLGEKNNIIYNSSKLNDDKSDNRFTYLDKSIYNNELNVKINEKNKKFEKENIKLKRTKSEELMLLLVN